MNVDLTEIEKFDEIASQWWDPEGPCKPLHDLNPHRLDFIQSSCLLPNQTILDVGCGGGILTEALSQVSSHVWGIDQAPKALEVAKKHAASLLHPPHYELSTVEAFAEKYPAHFDVITCMELLEHVPDPLSVIGACATLLKPGGDIFFSTLNRTTKAFLQAIIGAEYCLKLLPKGTHDYARFIRPSELTEWARSQKLILKNISGIQYHLLRKTFSLCADVSVNYLIHFQRDHNEG